MKNILAIVFVLSLGTCIAQQSEFNLQKNKLYKISLSGADNFSKADEVSRLMEKNMLSIFSYVDFTTGEGYFIVDNYYKVHEIEKMLDNSNEFKYISFEEIPLSKDIFLEIYFKRGGENTDDFSVGLPKKVNLGPKVELAEQLYGVAKEIWVENYPDSYNNLYSPKNNLSPEELKEKQNKGY